MTGETILVFSEEPDAVLGLVATARSALAGTPGRVEAAMLGDGAAARAGGADRLYRLLLPEGARHDPSVAAAALQQVVDLAAPRLILVASTKRGRETAARLAGVIDAAVTTGVSSVALEADGVRIHREVLSGNAIGEEVLLGPNPIVAVMSSAPTGGSPAAAPTEVTDVPIEPGPARITLVERTVKPAGGLRIESAERIVSVGRGLRKKEDLALIQELARAMGAVVGCTRPIAAEAGWLSDDHWIGLTGHRVKPRLYVAIGISGAVQHLVGMRESTIVVAVNKDANAPIFAQSDYTIAGDLYAVVPALVRALTGT